MTVVVPALAVAGLLLLTLGVGVLVLARPPEIKTQGLGLAFAGLLAATVPALFASGGRMTLAAILLAIFATVASAVSGYEIMRLIREGEGQAPPEDGSRPRADPKPPSADERQATPASGRPRDFYGS